MRFDIDAQPLANALRAYSESTRVAVLFDDELVADRISGSVHAVASKPEALRLLLLGTGLSGHFSSMSAFTVTASGPASSDRLPEAGEAGALPATTIDAEAAAKLQQDIERALCADKATRPGGYRMVLQLWPASNGEVQRVTLIGASSDSRRDKRVITALRGLHLAPRIGLGGPVTVLLEPSHGDHCAAREGTH